MNLPLITAISLCSAEMDNSVQSEFTDRTFTEQPAEMNNISPLALFKDDPEFDWKDFKDFQPLGPNTEPNWNAFQMDGYVDGCAQRVLHQQQVQSYI